MFFNINNYTYCVKVIAQRKVSHITLPKQITFLQTVSLSREEEFKNAEGACVEGQTVTLFNNKSMKLGPNEYQVLSIGWARNPHFLNTDRLYSEKFSCVA